MTGGESRSHGRALLAWCPHQSHNLYKILWTHTDYTSICRAPDSTFSLPRLPSTQWCRNKFESEGHTFFCRASPLFGSTSTVSRFGERFVMVSTCSSSVSCLLFFYSRCPDCPMEPLLPNYQTENHPSLDLENSSEQLLYFGDRQKKSENGPTIYH